MATDTPLIDPSSDIPFTPRSRRCSRRDRGGRCPPASVADRKRPHRALRRQPADRAQAVQNLVSRGLVEIRRGKGTFVTQPKITQELTALSGFVEDMQALGTTPTARLLDKQSSRRDKTVARQLAPARPGTRVVRIRRVRLADGVPLSFDETYLPRELGEKIITKRPRGSARSSRSSRRSTTCRSSRPSTGWKRSRPNPSWRRPSASQPAARSS